MLYLKNIFFSFFLVLTSFIGQAQQLEIGANVGGASYLGDLNQYNPAKISGVAAGVFAKVNFNPYVAVGLHYNYGKIEADDAKSSHQQFVDRNLKFITPLHEISALVELNLFDLTAYYRNTRFTPYLFVGVGTVIFNPKAIYKEETYELPILRTEGQSEAYKTAALTFPYGAGIKYKLKNNWTVFSQVGYRSPLTDYLDDVSGVYPDPSFFSLASTPSASRIFSDRSNEFTGVSLGKAGTQRGDFRKRDNYMFVGIGISYTFVSQKCFTF